MLNKNIQLERGVWIDIKEHPVAELARMACNTDGLLNVVVAFYRNRSVSKILRTVSGFYNGESNRVQSYSGNVTIIFQKDKTVHRNFNGMLMDIDVVAYMVHPETEEFMERDKQEKDPVPMGVWLEHEDYNIFDFANTYKDSIKDNPVFISFKFNGDRTLRFVSMEYDSIINSFRTWTSEDRITVDDGCICYSTEHEDERNGFPIAVVSYMVVDEDSVTEHYKG